ncbi:hypothetical protein [Thioalkalivibrio sp. ALE19]|uniref:hypothetical protein n=1 Tax=Thioalkalivibrio sp. ALE19 TaxID=1266909 RepID=UPI0012DE7E4D|nr:hypothetical protein [Thioalkalivibrio sp. ALE19]
MKHCWRWCAGVIRDTEALGITGEGCRKFWARLKGLDVAICQKRLLRLLPDHGLQAPHRQGTAWGLQVHHGTIISEAPNQMRGTDATQALTGEGMMATIFVAIDLFVGDVVGIHAARPGTRHEALEPIYQGIREH